MTGVVKDSWTEGGYIIFELEDGTRRSFPTTWAFFTGFENHPELKALAEQVEMKTIPCAGCGADLLYKFVPKEEVNCPRCQIMIETDRQIFRDLEDWAEWEKRKGH